MSGPIKPADAAAAKEKYIPEVVFDIFNEMIARALVNGHARVTQETVVERLVERGILRREIFDRDYLNVEDAYRAAGWNVRFEKPDYGGPGVFHFEERHG